MTDVALELFVKKFNKQLERLLEVSRFLHGKAGTQDAKEDDDKEHNDGFHHHVCWNDHLVGSDVQMKECRQQDHPGRR